MILSIYILIYIMRNLRDEKVGDHQYTAASLAQVASTAQYNADRYGT